MSDASSGLSSSGKRALLAKLLLEKHRAQIPTLGVQPDQMGKHRIVAWVLVLEPGLVVGSRVEQGEYPAAESPLARAPHTAEDVVGDKWDRPYTREEAAFPLDYLRVDKYWPPVGRIDGAYGDKNLACDCPALDAYR